MFCTVVRFVILLTFVCSFFHHNLFQITLVVSTSFCLSAYALSSIAFNIADKLIKRKYSVKCNSLINNVSMPLSEFFYTSSVIARLS